MATDAEILDQAIGNMESLQRHLFTFRAMIKKLGEIKTQHDQTKENLQSTERYRDDINRQVEVARAELAKIAQQTPRDRQ